MKRCKPERKLNENTNKIITFLDRDYIIGTSGINTRLPIDAFPRQPKSERYNGILLSRKNRIPAAYRRWYFDCLVRG